MKQYKISPFFTNGIWTFNSLPDMQQRTIYENQLVDGTDTLLQKIFDEVGAFSLLISDYPSTEYILAKHDKKLLLKWIDGNASNNESWNTYKLVDTNLECGLCPVLFDFWNPVPKYIYITIIQL